MNKKLFLILATFFMVGTAFAVDETFRIPSSNNGHPDSAAKYGGVDKVTLITSSTPVLASNADGTTITAGLVYWVVRPATAALGAFLELRDTNTANTSSIKMLPWIPAVSTSTIGSPFEDMVLKLDPPVPFYNGLSINIYPYASAAAAEWAVGVRPRR